MEQNRFIQRKKILRSSGSEVSCEYCKIFMNVPIFKKTFANGCTWNLVKVHFDHEILSFWNCYEKPFSSAF